MRLGSVPQSLLVLMYANIHNPISTARRRKSPAVAARRGFASGLVLLMLVFLAGFIALGLNVSRLSQAFDGSHKSQVIHGFHRELGRAQV